MVFFGKSQTAKKETDEKTATEIINLKITNAQLQSYKDEQRMPDLQYLADRLYEDNEIQYVYNESQKLATKEKIQVTGESIYTKLEEYPYEFQIDSNLRLASIDGVKIEETPNDQNYEELKSEIADLKAEINILKQQKPQEQELQRTKLLSAPVNIPFNGINTIWQNVDNIPDITLLDSIENYKYLIVNYDVKVLGMTIMNGERTEVITVEGVAYNNSNTQGIVAEAEILIVGDASVTCRGLDIWFKDSKTLHIGAVWCSVQELETFRIRNIYGIK